jgi:hypothetical protein
MASASITRQNHYVPIWYQKGFIPGPRQTLIYLDLDPRRHTLADGRVIVERKLTPRAPKSCFWAEDLYTTRFGDTINDEVERFLFGAIDNEGAQAVRAFAANDLGTMHRIFQRFFEYMNAQKLRTPKGLDWIKSKYPKLDQIELMIEMQHLRQMHCTMWFECVREIVSAEKSAVKFIVSDHPVTAYNPACPPSSPTCLYPEDPSIALIGTQTLFALDSNHCLILTNLEYAKNPQRADLLAPRQNARFFGQTIARTDAAIRTRFLTSEEVSSINRVLKARARKYIAAYEKEWLHPDTTTGNHWGAAAEILLPRDELWRFGGEIYIGYKDGSTQYQDPFGRTSSAHDFLKKEAKAPNLRPNDQCGCESGRRFKKCCSRVALEDRPPWNVLSIRERNRILYRAVIDTLELNKGKTWDDVRRELSDAQVKRIHEIMEMLWSPETNIAELLPRPDRRVTRAVYLGLIDPRTIAGSVASWLAYFDEIIIVHPFPNPRYMRPEFSPTHSPSQYKSLVLKNVALLLSLIPLIEDGIIHMVPDPMEFNLEFRQRLMAMAEARRDSFELDAGDLNVANALGRDDFQRSILRQPEEALRRQTRESQPEISPELLDKTIQYMKEKLQADPLALLQPLVPGKAGGEIQVFRGMSLELAMFLAQLTGSLIYTDSPAHWKQLLSCAKNDEIGSNPSSWTPVIEVARKISLITELNPLINLELRASGMLGSIRRVFRRVLNSVLVTKEDDATQIAQDLARRLENATRRTGKEWDECTSEIDPSQRLRRRMDLLIPKGGFALTTVQRLLVAFGRTNRLRSVPLAVYIDPPDCTMTSTRAW